MTRLDKPIVFASTSPYKRRLIEKLGLDIEFAAPSFEERPIAHLSPLQLAQHHAMAKAQSLRVKFPDHLIIAADQTLDLEGSLLSKPGSVANAVKQLLELSGRTHQLHTAYAMLHEGGGIERSVTSRMRMRSRLSATFLRNMVLSDQTLECCGGYKWESSGVILFDQVETPDHHAIIGLPLVALANDLADLGYLHHLFKG